MSQIQNICEIVWRIRFYHYFQDWRSPVQFDLLLTQNSISRSRYQVLIRNAYASWKLNMEFHSHSIKTYVCKIFLKILTQAEIIKLLFLSNSFIFPIHFQYNLNSDLNPNFLTKNFFMPCHHVF